MKREIKGMLTGLGVTFRTMMKPAVTVQYPHEALKMSPRFRGHIELVRDPATGQPKCFVCKLCEKACPSDCITVEGIKPEGARRKTVTYYRLDFTKCSLCGSCVEACRDGAIRFSRDYNLASTSKEDFIMDLFKRLEAQGGASENPNGLPTSGQAVKAEILKPVEPKSEPSAVQVPATVPTNPTALQAEAK